MYRKGAGAMVKLQQLISTGSALHSQGACQNDLLAYGTSEQDILSRCEHVLPGGSGLKHPE
jgi:hypothetical protein